MSVAVINTDGMMTFQATAVPLARGVLVTLDSSRKVAVAGATDYTIGVTMEACAESGYVLVKTWNATGTFLIQAHSTMACGAAPIYPAAAGRVDDAGSTVLSPGLICLEEVTAQGDIVEFARSGKGA